MAFRRITAFVVPLGVLFIAFVGFAALSTSGDTGPSVAINTVDQTELPVRARVAAAVFAARFERSLESDLVIVAATTTTTAQTSTTAPPAAKTTTTKPRDAKPKDTTPPALRVKSPKDGAEVETKVVEFRGTTEPGADVFSGPYDATVTSDGDWKLSLTLLKGANIARITARDAAGNETTERLIVNYNPPKTTTTTKAPKRTTTTTKSPKTTTTTKAPTTTTTAAPSQWSPKWPADSGGTRNVEYWRADVEKHWPANRVDCALGIIKKESRGDPRARNTAYDTRGLMQHLFKYWKGRAKGAGFVDGNGLVAHPYNGEANIAAGAYLANYYDSIGKDWWRPWGSSLPSYGSCGS